MRDQAGRPAGTIGPCGAEWWRFLCARGAEKERSDLPLIGKYHNSSRGPAQRLAVRLDRLGAGEQGCRGDAFG